jgi:hypothetical protein
MKDICVLRYHSRERFAPKRAQTSLQTLVLPGETIEFHEVDEWTTIIEIHRGASRSGDSQVVVASGAACAYSGHLQPRFRQSFLRGDLIGGTGRSIRLSESPGGISANFHVSRESGLLFAWPSLSNWERVYYTKAPDLVVVSNSALLSHCLAGETAVPQMNPAWLEDVLIGMGSLLEHTQFAGTMVVPSRRSLRVTRDCKISLEGSPLRVERHSRESGSSAAVEELADELVFAISPLTNPDRSLFRVSSGKDSRLIAALCRSANLLPKTVTYGEEGVQNAAVVAMLAKALSMPVETTRSPQCGRDGLLANVREQSRRADFAFLAGQQLVKPLDEFDGFDVVIEGHAHHLRGGYAMNRELSRDEAFQVFWKHQNAGAQFAFPGLRERKKALISDMFDDMLKESSPHEALYWAYADRRVLMTQQYYRRRARVVDQLPPLMDERVLLATSRAHISDLGSEQLFYKVLTHFSPAATQVPIYGKTWRFAAHVSKPFVLKTGSAKSPGEKPAHTSLVTAVEILNAMIEKRLPFDMRDLTPERTFHKSRVSVADLRSNGKSLGSNLDYLWKIIGLAHSFGPKDMLRVQGQTHKPQPRLDRVLDLSPG